RRIDGDPAESAEVNLGATVLRLADDLAACPQALVAKARWRNADAVDVACGQSDRARQPDIERVQVSALAAEIAGLQHCGNVADAAAARLRFAERVIDNPLVDTPRLFDIAEGPAHDVVGGRFDDAVRRHQIGRGGIEFALIGRERRHAATLGEIDRAITRRNVADDLHDRGPLAVRPFDVQHLRPVFRIALELRRLPVARPFVAERFNPAGLGNRRQRQPYLHLPRWLDDLDASGDLEL